MPLEQDNPDYRRLKKKILISFVVMTKTLYVFI